VASVKEDEKNIQGRSADNKKRGYCCISILII
jgi:hypothetical protein